MKQQDPLLRKVNALRQGVLLFHKNIGLEQKKKLGAACGCTELFIRNMFAAKVLNPFAGTFGKRSVQEGQIVFHAEIEDIL